AGEPLLELDETAAGPLVLASDRVEQRFEADADADQARVARRAPQLLALHQELPRPGEIAGGASHARRGAGRQRGAAAVAKAAEAFDGLLAELRRARVVAQEAS